MEDVILDKKSDNSTLNSMQDVNYSESTTMKCLLKKIDQLNQLIDKIKMEDSSIPIEPLINNELFAISLLKKEIRETKRQIDENKTYTEIVKTQKPGTEKFMHIRKIPIIIIISFL